MEDSFPLEVAALILILLVIRTRDDPFLIESILGMVRSLHLELIAPPLLVSLAWRAVRSDALATGRLDGGRVRPTIGLYRITFNNKANKNVLIVGTTGKGKTNLMDLILSRHFDRYAVLSFKEGDLHLGLDADIVDVSRYGPFDRDGFVDAFMLTFQPAVVGEVVSRYPGLLQDMIVRSDDWPSLLGNLDRAIKRERDRINRTALMSLREKILLLMPRGSGDVPLGDRVVYDFSGLNEYQRSFFAELILRKLASSSNMAVGIDEAYLIFRRTEHHFSVVERMLREGRARKLAVIVATQSILDVPAPVISQFDTIYVFSTSGADIDLLGRMGVSRELIASLGNYECVDVRGDPVVLRFRRFRPRERIVREEVRAGARDGAGGEEPAGVPGGRGMSYRDVSYRDEILTILAERGPMNLMGITRVIADKYPLKRSTVKLECLREISRLYEEGLVKRVEIIDELGRKMVYYELPSTSESGIHKLMMDRIRAMAIRLGLNVESGERVDLIVGNIGIEVETGKKTRKPERDESVVVVVPNEEVRERYPGSVTLRGLYLMLRGKEMGEIRASPEYVKGVIRGYLRGKGSMNWVMGVIRSSGIRGTMLKSIMEELREEGYDAGELEGECRKRGFI